LKHEFHKQGNIVFDHGKYKLSWFKYYRLYRRKILYHPEWYSKCLNTYQEKESCIRHSRGALIYLTDANLGFGLWGK